MPEVIKLDYFYGEESEQYSFMKPPIYKHSIANKMTQFVCILK